jgi:Glycosyl transferases group 1
MSGILKVAHRAWTCLPAGWRQRAYEDVTCALAPAARAGNGVPASWEPPYIVAGPLSAPTGLGESARLLLQGLLALGLPVSYIDLSGPMMQKSVVPMPDLPPPQPGPGTLLLAVQPPSVGHALLLLGRPFLTGKRRIGFWMWELETLPRQWRKSVPLVHDLAAPSRFAGSVLARELDVPVRFLGFPFQPYPPRRQQQNAAITFGVGFDMGSTAARKNPFASVEAFLRAFPEDEPVRLLVKVRGEEADRVAFEKLTEQSANSNGRVQLVVGDLDRAQLALWWDELDVLVSLHRSEGFGLFPAEAMLQGIPVIATDWSATAEFVTSGIGWPVACRLVPVEDATGRYQLPGARWAEPDLDSAAAAMREAFAEGRQGLKKRGESAATLMNEVYSFAAFGQRLTDASAFTIQP